MPLIVITNFITAFRHADELQIVNALIGLTCPADETCTVSIGERGIDADIHVTITRSRSTLIWSDWTVSECGGEPNTYKYEKAFHGNPSASEIAASVGRMLLESPEDT